MAQPKIPESVLVVIHSAAGEVLLLERADHPGFWQSVTGSRDALDEPLRITCAREVAEETGFGTAPEATSASAKFMFLPSAYTFITWPGDAVVLMVAVVSPLFQPRRCASTAALVAVVPV